MRLKINPAAEGKTAGCTFGSMKLQIILQWAMAACLAMLLHSVSAQQNEIEVKGITFDQSGRVPLEGVIVQATNGRGTVSDSLGKYSIWARPTDSVYFSYQGRVTGKYPVATMEDPKQFSMALHVRTHQLPPVTIFGRNYMRDSLENRMVYAKYFDWRKENPLNSINMSNGSVGMDPNAIINLFRFRRNRQLTALRERLVGEEQEKYISNRYSRKLVGEITGLKDERLTHFMEKYRPPYEFVAVVNDLELAYYVDQCFKAETGNLPPGTSIYLLGVDPLEYENRRY